MLSDGVSQLFLDFSLHGEEGKDKQKVQGLTAKQRKARYTEAHEGQAVKERVDEYLMKILHLMKNINKAKLLND